MRRVIASRLLESKSTIPHLYLAADVDLDRVAELREALKHIISDCEADYPPSHGAIKYAAKLALKGETP